MAVRLAIAQINTTVGDIQGNTALIRSYVSQAAGQGAGLVIFPEMSVCGYPPEDLLLRPRFLQDCRLAVEKLASAGAGLTVVVGFPEAHQQTVYNSLAVLRDGQIAGIYRKAILPNYGVFDEQRYFTSGAEPLVIEAGGVNVALTVCEDIWTLPRLDNLLSKAPPFGLIVNSSASPFHCGKILQRREAVSRCAAHFSRPLLYCNMVGGQDELVFDGRSMAVDRSGSVLAQAAAFEQDLLIIDAEAAGENQFEISCPQEQKLCKGRCEFDSIAEVYNALVLGTRDYVRKNGFTKVLIGVSGGIDSALTAVIAADALGAENVIGVTMPSRFNSPATCADAGKLAESLGIQFRTLHIGEILEQFSKSLSQIQGWDEKGLAYENLQARIRGSALMSLSNQFSCLVLTTGNKSETAVGYSTLYGDTAGGFAVIKDVPKTMVYQLSRYVNDIAGRERIPQSIIDRIPSAELRENQKDSDSLPEYDLLDRILAGYIEQDKSPTELIASGLPAKTVEKVVRLVDRSEYKRRQCPPGVKITPRAFGRDRRMPITNRYIP